MKLYTVDSATWKPNLLIEGYSSLIWTERFSEAGEFELRTPLISEFLTLLPEETLLTHQDTQEVFVVDTLNIEKNDEGASELVIKGLSYLEKALRDRVSPGTYRQEWLMPRSYTGAQAAAILIYNYLCNPYNKDLTRSAMYGLSASNRIPNTGVGLRVNTYMPWSGDWWMQTGEVYPIFTDFLARSKLGARTVRPLDIYNSYRIDMTYSSVDSAGGFGVEAEDSKLRFMVYSGYDRQDGTTPSFGSRVAFKWDEGDLSDPKYLFSTRDLKTMCTVNSSIGSVDVYSDDTVAPYLTGTQRRQMWLDGGDVGDQDPTAFITALVQKGEIELAKYNRKQLFDAQITETTPYKYKKDYDLGDRVTLYGEYGFRPTMRVNEYVRIDDEEGDRGYPTLILA